MSFSTDVKTELNSIKIKANCCKKAYLVGIIMSARVCYGNVRLKISDASTAEQFLYFLKSLYKIEPKIKQCVRGCYRATEIEFESASLSELLELLDSDTDTNNAPISSIFKCSSCREAFVRALFCACGTVSDPRKSYTLEIRVPTQSRAQILSKLISELGLSEPCITERNGAYGLFYRNESSIEDMLTACGASKSLFIFLDATVEKDLRNTENRATNCVAKNISKSVTAAAVQVSAIEALIANGMFDELADDLKKTANLRLEYPDVSLTELVQLHKPSISKSGLNHRLSRLIEEAKRKGLI